MLDCCLTNLISLYLAFLCYCQEPPAELEVYFTNEISGMLAAKGKRMMGWNEITGDKLHEYQSDADTEELFVVRQSSESLLNKRINQSGVKPCACLQVYYPEALL